MTSKEDEKKEDKSPDPTDTKKSDSRNDDDIDGFDDGSQASKIAKQVGFILRTKDRKQVQELLEIKESVGRMQAELETTRRELDIERVSKEFSLDNDSKVLLTGRTREEINNQGKALRAMLDKKAGASNGGEDPTGSLKADPEKSEEEKKRLEKPELKEGIKPKGGDPDAYPKTDAEKKERYERAKKELGW